MSASLVGSEMCIRDSSHSMYTLQARHVWKGKAPLLRASLSTTPTTPPTRHACITTKKNQFTKLCTNIYNATLLGFDFPIHNHTQTSAPPKTLPQHLTHQRPSPIEACKRSMAKSMPPHISVGTKVRQLGSFASARFMQASIFTFYVHTASKACLEGESAAA